ncbi:scavenger receptor class F member 1-like [Gigantopelta aegis]|uniref:scavenger receptor class F member 1-like n=1 Tax=Gigantopelta aegis TaxID=1735272 RepID=UPI001B88AABA|nr:scavenger receptor class F member 1-like [Gigantopelta aegis]
MSKIEAIPSFDYMEKSNFHDMKVSIINPKKKMSLWTFCLLIGYRYPDGTKARHQDRLTGLRFEVDKHECYSWSNSSSPPNEFEVNCDQDGENVTFKLPVNATYNNVLTLCEIQVFVCTDFWYGEDCDKTCNCRNQTEVCNKTTGGCTACPDGWNGTACDTCAQGHYGENCIEECGHCLNGESECITTNGHCSNGCKAGWNNDTCKIACTPGHYGDNCIEECEHYLNGQSECNMTTGHCSGGCKAGWSNNTCKAACKPGQYGQNCANECEHCLNGESECDKTNGHCSNGCKENICQVYLLIIFLHRDMPACKSGQYGQNCANECGHCLNGESECNKTNGHCSTGCKAGWKNNACKTVPYQCNWMGQ